MKQKVKTNGKVYEYDNKMAYMTRLAHNKFKTEASNRGMSMIQYFTYLSEII